MGGSLIVHARDGIYMLKLKLKMFGFNPIIIIKDGVQNERHTNPTPHYATQHKRNSSEAV